MRNKISKEVLSLFCIVCSAIMLGKVMLEVKDAINDRVEKLESHIEHINYSINSIKPKKEIKDLDELTVIRNMDELKTFKEEKVSKQKNDWLNKKLDLFSNEDFYLENTLVVLCLENKGDVVSNRITDVYKDNNKVIIEIDKRKYDTDVTKSWVAVVEINDVGSNIKLDINEY